MAEGTTDRPNLVGPFTPLGPTKASVKRIKEGDTIPPSSEERQAHALEYIAAQLGEINSTLKKISDELLGKNAIFRP